MQTASDIRYHILNLISIRCNVNRWEDVRGAVPGPLSDLCVPCSHLPSSQVDSAQGAMPVVRFAFKHLKDLLKLGPVCYFLMHST